MSTFKQEVTDIIMQNYIYPQGLHTIIAYILVLTYKSFSSNVAYNSAITELGLDCRSVLLLLENMMGLVKNTASFLSSTSVLMAKLQFPGKDFQLPYMVNSLFNLIVPSIDCLLLFFTFYID